MANVDNTFEQRKKDPGKFLAEAMVMGVGGAIEAEEARGQAQLVAASEGGEALIARMLYSPREEFEALGFAFLGDVEGDDLFQRVRFPAGWKMDGTGHSMWTKLIDADGFQRASQFYKAAFYDRNAHIGLTSVPTTEAQDEAEEILMGELQEADGDRWRYPERRKARDDEATGPILLSFHRYALGEGGGKDYLHADSERRYHVEPDGTPTLLLELAHDPPVRFER